MTTALEPKAAYISRRIGDPWEIGGLHCWALVRETQLEVYGRELPEIDGLYALDAKELVGIFISHPERRNWQEVPGPVDGAIVLMSRPGGRSRDIHAGTYMAVDRGGVLHVDSPQGVAFDSMIELTRVRRWKPSFFMPGIHG